MIIQSSRSNTFFRKTQATEAYGSNGFPVEEERTQYTHRIGNLALLSRRMNAQAQNYDFDKKKESYFTTCKGVSPFALTTQVLQKTEWTPAIINQRQKELLQKLKTLYGGCKSGVSSRQRVVPTPGLQATALRNAAACTVCFCQSKTSPLEGIVFTRYSCSSFP